MMRITSTLILLLLITACTKTSRQEEAAESLSDIEKIARAHGIDKFTDLTLLQYTFNVKRDTVVGSRTWQWQPKNDAITYIAKGDTTHFTQDNITEDLKKIHHRFINDKYWLIFPFQLVWDDNIIATSYSMVNAPISGSPLKKITIQYGAEGGYTPGDAYDIYVDDNWIIREWAFRKGGQDAPTLITTWEDYKDYKGLLIATNHVNADGNFSIFFTDLVVK